MQKLRHNNMGVVEGITITHRPTAGDRLVLASHNAGKLVELQSLLSPLGLVVISAAELGLPEPVEDGDTFHANAALKARAAATASGLWSLSDDSGLVVTALNGAPGIYSARWAGPNKDFSMAMQRIAAELDAAGSIAEGADAYFVCVIALASPAGDCFYFEGRSHGTLCYPPRGGAGFGYDPMFLPEGETRSFAQMSLAEKQGISHRARAFHAFEQWLQA
jgi:XTP/dITP diphosphohydrolase